MIQRKQTVFLALAIILNIVFLFTPLFTHMLEMPNELITGLMAGLGIGLLASSGITVVAIFRYDNYDTQIKLIGYAALFEGVAAGIAAGTLFSMGHIGSDSIGELTGAGLLALAILLQLLGIKGVKDDKKLIKSMDRLRD
jgi:hypothetical protein